MVDIVERLSINFLAMRIYADPEGPFVRYSDYDILAARIAELEAERELIWDKALEDAETRLAEMAFKGAIDPFGSRNIHNCAISDAIIAIRQMRSKT